MQWVQYVPLPARFYSVPVTDETRSWRSVRTSHVQILQTVAGGSRGLGYIYAGRVIAGLGIGAISAVAPAFVSECSPKDVRGRITGMFQIMVAVGVMLSYFINCEFCASHGTPCYFPDGADVPWQLELASTPRQGTQSGECCSASSSYLPA